MTRLVARLVLAMLLLPLTGALTIICLVAMTAASGTGPPRLSLVLAMWLLVYLFIALYWILLWRSVVRWSARRKSNTLMAGLGALAGALLIAGLIAGLPGTPPLAFAALVAGGVAPIIWVVATVFIWRETPAERMERIRAGGRENVACPICGYNMTGLRDARCPECGAQFTLNELLGAQRPADAVLETE